MFSDAESPGRGGGYSETEEEAGRARARLRLFVYSFGSFPLSFLCFLSFSYFPERFWEEGDREPVLSVWNRIRIICKCR